MIFYLFTDVLKFFEKKIHLKTTKENSFIAKTVTYL